jgi:nucleotidyltransferase/DNA polymerase involved in DNA repair
MQRVILHLDMDAFYAAVEVREDPSLAGKPLIIGHRGRRGVVSTCSYEARKFGVHSAMPSVTAERLCPEAVWLHGRMDLYVEISRRIRRILRASAPVVEPLSIDEAFLDMTGVVADLDEGRAAAARIKTQIVERERLTASVGVAPNKFLAKIASDMEKPDGLVVFPLEDVETRLWPMPIRRLWGVGPKSAERLATLGISTIGDLLCVPESDLVARLGPASAEHLLHLARGEDDRPVQSHHEPKSISEERTYGTDLTDPDEIDRAMLARAEGVARELRRDRLAGRTVHIKVRTGDFTTWTRSLTLRKPTDLAEVIVDAARRIYRERIELRGRGVRLLGVGVSGLEHPGTGQETLFPDPGEEAARKRARATDLIRNKLGEKAVTRARLVRKPEDEDDPDEASSLPAVD